LASSIVNKLIHGTMVTLKSEVNSSSGAAFVEAARRFFNLESRPSPDAGGESSVEPSSCAAHDTTETLIEQAPSRTTGHKQTQ
jgi:glutamyl-tRNA reductase